MHNFRIVFTSKFLTLAFFVFFYQQLILVNIISPIKLYMIFSLILTILLIVNSSLIKVRRLETFELLWFLFLFLNLFTVLLAENLLSSMSLFLGTFILFSFYISYRVLFDLYPVNVFINTFLTAFYIFIILSILTYFMGLYDFYILGNVPEGESYAARSLYGVLFEGVKPRLRGISDSPNNFGLFFIIGYATYLFHEKNKTKRLFMAVLLLTSLFLSMSTTALLAVITITLLYSLKRKNGVVELLTLCLLLIIVLYAWVMMTENYEQILIEKLDRIRTGSGRYELWDYTISKIMESPIFGYGLNQSREFLMEDIGLKTTHNAFLSVWLEGGIFILCLHVIFWLSILFQTFFLYLRTKGGDLLFPLTLGMLIFSNSNVTVYTEIFTFYLVFSSFLLKRSFNRKELDTKPVSKLNI